MAPTARQAARQILETGQYSVPIDVDAVAAQLNIAILLQELDDTISGLLVVKDGRGIIVVNQIHPPNRRRFTIAHEVGHYILHQANARVFVDATPVFFRDESSSSGTLTQEIEANAFAAELLMPEYIVHETLSNQPLDAFDESAVQQVAKIFGVSPQALTIRLTKLGLITL